MRGQGSTEYLVSLAVVLVVALSAVTLLSFYPSTASDSNMQDSNAYWRSATPLRVSYAAPLLSACGQSRGYTFSMENSRSDSVLLTGVMVDNQSRSFCASGASSPSASVNLGIGGKALVDIAVNSSCIEGQMVDLGLSFKYNTANIKNMVQYGSNKLSVRCGPAPSVPSCASAAQSCANLSCCSGLQCIGNSCMYQCSHAGGSCSGPGTSCCSGLECSSGTCSAPCIPENIQCKPGVDCCSGLACDLTNICARCFGQGADCSNGELCCSGLACNGAKMCARCVRENGGCGGETCCDGLYCNDGLKCAACLLPGVACLPGETCCSFDGIAFSCKDSTCQQSG